MLTIACLGGMSSSIILFNSGPPYSRSAQCITLYYRGFSISPVLIVDLKYFHSAVSTTAMSATVGRQKKNKQTQKSSQMMMILMLINNKQKSIKSCCEKHKSVRMEKDHYFVKKFLAVDLVCLFFFAILYHNTKR